jgi:hypothetical protein
LKPEGQKYLKNKKLKKCTTTNTRYDVQKQYSLSAMTAIPIYHLSRSGMRLITSKRSATHSPEGTKQSLVARRV